MWFDRPTDRPIIHSDFHETNNNLWDKCRYSPMSTITPTYRTVDPWTMWFQIFHQSAFEWLTIIKIIKDSNSHIKLNGASNAAILDFRRWTFWFSNIKTLYTTFQIIHKNNCVILLLYIFLCINRHILETKNKQCDEAKMIKLDGYYNVIDIFQWEDKQNTHTYTH